MRMYIAKLFDRALEFLKAENLWPSSPSSSSRLLHDDETGFVVPLEEYYKDSRLLTYVAQTVTIVNNNAHVRIL
jgi:hypothetical protein